MVQFLRPGLVGKLSRCKYQMIDSSTRWHVVGVRHHCLFPKSIRRSRLLLLTSFALIGAPASLIPDTASACGGTFCDGGPNAMPVDQTGENILFVLEQDSVEAHIQIQVAADAVAEQFAWVIPMMEIPAFSLGSQEVFDARFDNGHTVLDRERAAELSSQRRVRKASTVHVNVQCVVAAIEE